MTSLIIICHKHRIFLLSCLMFLEVLLVAAQQGILKQGEFIDSDSTLVSSSNMFAMRFFNPKDSNFSYLGIWYQRPVEELFFNRPVWVANRNIPIHNNSGMLTIDPESGNLIITHKGASSPIVLYSGGSQSPGLNRTATLLDSGNFVLKEGNVTLWQSFDHPTDTLLPEMKLGINHKTNQTWSLTSWLGKSEPAPGAFTLEWDPWDKILVVKFRGKVHWTSGKFVGKDFKNIRDDYKFKNVSDENEDYFSYTLMGDPFYKPVFISGWQLDYQGNIYDQSRRRQVAAADDCYGYNIVESYPYIEGCELWQQPKCRNDLQKFVIQTDHFEYFNFSEISDNNTSLGYGDCKAKCWEDCNCLGFRNSGETGCLFYEQSEKKFHSNGNSEKIYILKSYSAANPSDPLQQTKRDKGISIVVIISLVYLVLLLLSGILRNQWEKIKKVTLILTTDEHELQELLAMNGYKDTNSELGNHGTNDPKFFSYKSIAAATSNFLPDNKLGEGGFGPVFKGELPGGQKIAVKRLARKSTQGMVELKNEVILIAKLQHTNLVRLLGCCIHREDKLLIYEYMPNKSLDSFLFDESKREQLTWEIRFSIIEGIAQGLLYLHKYSRLRIIHRDLKAANILLDQNMNPKISDFGLARIFKQNLLEANTNRVVGTYGYMAPEYAMEGRYSVKSDVYSFGVLILEILSGRKNNSFYHAEVPFNLVSLAWEFWNSDAALELMDSSISNLCIEHQFLRCVHIGLLCVEDRALDRPTMVDVISMLVNNNSDMPLPKRPAFYTGGSLGEHELEETTSSQKMSVNGLSISTTEPR